VIRADKLKQDGYRDLSKWMHQAEAIWKKNAKEKGGEQDLYERLDYQKELTGQNLEQRYLVLYNGSNVAATFFDRKSESYPLSLSTLLLGAFSNRDEAHYLCAVLNSQVVNLAI